jgi:hypothetical protein
MCPYLLGSLDAPTTAKYGEEKKARAAASVAILGEVRNYLFVDEPRLDYANVANRIGP